MGVMCRPLNFPRKPMFGRRSPDVDTLVRIPGAGMPRDDELHIVRGITFENSKADGRKFCAHT